MKAERSRSLTERCNHLKTFGPDHGIMDGMKMMKKKNSELISPEFLEHLFGKPASVPPKERSSRQSQTELISPEFLAHLFGGNDTAKA